MFTWFIAGSKIGCFFWGYVGMRKFNNQFPGPWRRTKQTGRRFKEWFGNFLFGETADGKWNGLIEKWHTVPMDKCRARVRKTVYKLARTEYEGG